ncbi:hypothetical protein T484DRAFT_1949024, partial [Baffinella frigidus]
MGASALCFLMLGFALSSACTSAPPLALSRPAHQDDGRAGAGCGGSWGARWDAGALGARCTAGKFALSLRGGGGPPKVRSAVRKVAGKAYTSTKNKPEKRSRLNETVVERANRRITTHLTQGRRAPQPPQGPPWRQVPPEDPIPLGPLFQC